MKTNTTYFGMIDYTEKDILHIPDGLFGFEDKHEYLLIHFSEDNQALLCMQSLDEPTLAFIIANPFSIAQDYSPEVSADDMKALGLTNDSLVSFYVLCVVRDAMEGSTVNLRSPLVINPETRIARQVVLDDTSLSFKHPMKQTSAPGKEESAC